MKTQTAKYDPSAPTKWTTGHRKEGKCFFNTVSIISLADKPVFNGRVYPKIEARFYGTGNMNFCCLWVHTEPVHTQGSGSAGGYGYHRPSAAFSEAVRNAGFTLSKDVAGVGYEAVREAMLAMAKTLKIKRPAIVESYQ